MELIVGGNFKCPEGHTAKIVWLSEDKTVVAVTCPHEHLKSIVKVNLKPGQSARDREKREIYVKNMVFIIRT